MKNKGYGKNLLQRVIKSLKKMSPKEFMKFHDSCEEQPKIQKKIVVVANYSRGIVEGFKKDGSPSGEEFLENFLMPAFENRKDNEKVLVDFDGMFGCTTSFLSVAFGGLARRLGTQYVLDSIEFKAVQRPALIEKALRYIKESTDV